MTTTTAQSMSYSPDQRKGVLYAASAFVMWGLSPMFFKLLAAAPAMEILVHRVVWSFVLMLVVIGVIKQWTVVKEVLLSPRKLGFLVASATLLAANWGLFIWAVNDDRVLEASLGYYINPLMNVLLAMVFLSERLSRWQGVSVALATIGVFIQVVTFGSFPYVSVALAVSFSIYGLLRKKVGVDSMTGMLIESAIMLPVALAYWSMFAQSDVSNMLVNDWGFNLLLIGTGVVTTLPLLAYAAGTSRIQYTTVGFLTYIGPSFMFIQAVFIYDEAVGLDRWITFGFIWAALAVYSWDSIRGRR